MNASHVARTSWMSTLPTKIAPRRRFCSSPLKNVAFLLPLLAVSVVTLLAAETALASSELAQVSAPTGPARRWSAGLPVGPYSQVHMETGRLWTAVPIVGWSGRGPAVNFALYHHMISPFGRPLDYPGGFGLLMGDANFDGQVNEADVDPFAEIMMELDPTEMELAVSDFDASAEVDVLDMESFAGGMAMMQGGLPLWTHTYDTCIYVQTNKRTVIWGDGTKDAYLWHAPSQSWKPPAGVFNTLVAEGSPVNGYMLTTKRQVKVHFLADGKLDYIEDPSGNRVTCTYINTNPQDPANGKLDFVTDAAGRVLDLDYNIHGKLSLIIAPLGVTNTPGVPTTRTWTLLYGDTIAAEPIIDGDGALLAIEDPLGHRIEVTYNAGLDIETITDKNGSSWELAYASNGRLATAIDPLTHDEHFVQYTVPGGIVEGQYTDVRGKLWKIRHGAGTNNQNLLSVTNPLNQTESLFYFGFNPPPPQLAHEPTSRQNALGKTWFFSYDDVGNVLTTTDPLDNVTTYTYDPSINNLWTMTPPGWPPGTGNALKTVDLFYDNGAHPTSVTRVIQPPPDLGGNEATTQIEYYGNNEGAAPYPQAWNGLVHRVTDPNGVVTKFTYDQWGQPKTEVENPPPEAGGSEPSEAFPIVATLTDYNEGGGQIGGTSAQTIKPNCPCCGPNLSIIFRDASNRVHEVQCPGLCFCFCEKPGEPDVSSVLTSGCFTADLSATGAPNSVNRCVDDPFFIGEANARDMEYVYDAFDRPLSTQLETMEPVFNPTGGSLPITRTFTNTYDDVMGVYTTMGPDGRTMTVTLDDAGRTQTVERETAPPEADSITAVYTYDAAGRVTLIEQGNGVDVRYEYDDANKLTQIRHEKASDQSLIFQLDYVWTPDGLGDWISETTPSGWAEMVFDYDNRNRLIEEERVGQQPYYFGYTYDQGGNRLSKLDFSTGFVTTYYYDITDLDDGDQHNNRLLRYEVSDGETVVERVWYRYGAEGNVARLVKDTGPGAPGSVDAYWFYYSTSNQLWMAVKGTGTYDDQTGELTNTTFVSAAEYRYDSGRQRYLVRPRDPNDDFALMCGTGAPDCGAQWRDYLGQSIYGDYSVVQESGVVTEKTAYLAGRGFDDPAGSNMPSYFVGDLIGTTRGVTDQLSALGGQVTYTAFGERVSGDEATRYGYAGAWGYESAGTSDPLTELGWLHVGERYYDPAVGRFMQRDPIGVRGGLNTYEYVRSMPMNNIDPSGHTSSVPEWDWDDFGGAVAWGGAAGGIRGSTAGPPGVLVGVPVGGTIGGMLYGVKVCGGIGIDIVRQRIRLSEEEERIERLRWRLAYIQSTRRAALDPSSLDTLPVPPLPPQGYNGEGYGFPGPASPPSCPCPGFPCSG